MRRQGHTIDCARPSYFSLEKYIQHVYMILGRAQALECSLFRNLPTTDDGGLGRAFFESGLLQYTPDLLYRLTARADSPFAQTQ